MLKEKEGELGGEEAIVFHRIVLVSSHFTEGETEVQKIELVQSSTKS